MTQEMTAEDYEAMQGLLAEVLGRGGTLADLHGISDDECEALYALGYGLYEQRRYEDALKVLAFLVAHNHMEHRYLMALGSAAQVLGKYRDALQQFAAATLLDPLEPLSVLQSAECLLALGKHSPAAESLSLALEMCKPGRHDAIKERALLLRQTMQATA